MNQSNRRITRSRVPRKCDQVKPWDFLINTSLRLSKNKAHIPKTLYVSMGQALVIYHNPSAIKMEMVIDLFSTQFSMYSLPIYHNKLLKVIN